MGGEVQVPWLVRREGWIWMWSEGLRDLFLEYGLLHLKIRDGRVSGQEEVWWVSEVGLGVSDPGWLVAARCGGLRSWRPGDAS